MDNDKENQEKSMQNAKNLQGDSSIDEPNQQEELHEDKPDEIEENEINHWVREISDDADLQDEDIVESLENVPVSKGDLPDWINELSPRDPEFFDSDEESRESKNQPEYIEMESKDDSLDTDNDNGSDHDEEQKDFADNPDDSEEGFVEISELDLNSESEPKTGSTQSEERSDEQEELPDWLEDMISEQPEQSSEKEEINSEERIFMNDEPTKPVPIIEDSVSTDDEQQEVEEKFVTPNLTLDEIEITESESQIEEIIHIVDFNEDTSLEELKTDEELDHGSDQEPLELSDEEETPSLVEESLDEDDVILVEEDWEPHDQESLGIPKSLRFAKYLLDQKEIEPAYKIFETYINKSDYLEEIKTWITDAINNENSSESKLWELLGDIALQKNEHNEALSAYTKSIKILLND